MSESGMKCPITHCDLEVGSKAVRLPCQHIFDEEAILQWLENERSVQYAVSLCLAKVPIGMATALGSVGANASYGEKR